MPRWHLLPFLHLLLLCLLSPSHANITNTNGASPSAVLSVVFTNWKGPPFGWAKQTSSRLATSEPTRWLRSDPGISRDFNFMLVTSSLRYVHFAPSPGNYVFRLGVYDRRVCAKRRPLHAVVNGVEAPVFNGAAMCGCGVKTYLDIPIVVDESRRIEISISQVKAFWRPAVSNFELFKQTNAPTPFTCPSNGNGVTVTPPTTTMPMQTISYRDVDVHVNTGVDAAGMVRNARPFVSRATVTVPASIGLPRVSFSSVMQGVQFSYSFSLPAGSYNIQLGFIELAVPHCSAASRMFNVHINGHLRLEGYDIYTAAGSRCRTATIAQFSQQRVDVDPVKQKVKPLVISFTGVAGLASISHVAIQPAVRQCTPVADNVNPTADHFAHAVPGDYPPTNGVSSYVDRTGKGFVWVMLDGSASHTHFSYGMKTGRVTSYTWSLAETGQVVSTAVRFRMRFNLGTTRLLLVVTDDACTSDEAETSVSVTGRIQPGAYCYVYDNLATLPMGGTLSDATRPMFSAMQPTLNGALASLPDKYNSMSFVARCLFFVDFTKHSEVTGLSVYVGTSGVARLYKGNDLILDTGTARTVSTSTTVGLQHFELLYHRTETNASPRLRFLVNGTTTAVSHDQATVLPVLVSLTPRSGQPQGGERVRLFGYGLYTPLTVSFGNQNITVETQASEPSSNVAVVTAPRGSGRVNVRVASASGLTSNAVTYSYGSTCDPVRFVNREIRMPNGGPVKIGLPTAMAVWQDAKLYIGTLSGNVHVVEYDHESLTVKDMCRSEHLRDSRYVKDDGSLSPRVVLGLTFHPADTTPRPYVSLSTLYWQNKANIRKSDRQAWANGAVVRLKPATAQTKRRNNWQCLEYDTTIVRNLPVSNRDHAINDLLFTQDGDLLISVGGNTNAGLRGYIAGGIWESFYSAAVVVARTSRGALFNGDIRYTTPNNLRTARPIGSNVIIYATGVRNMFAMTMARSGRVYGIDMGANCRAGNASTSCSEYVERDAARLTPNDQAPIPGKSIVGSGSDCTYGAGRIDKLLWIRRGAYYGHPNLQRAKLTGQTGECGWIDPYTGRTGRPLRSPAPASYVEPMLMVRSAMTGLREYGASLFCGRLRSTLVMSKFQARGVQRVTLAPDGRSVRVNGPVETFHSATGGLRLEENPHGDLIFTRYALQDDAASVFYVMRPVVSSRTGLFVVNAVPFRHGRKGGTTVVIGGWGFKHGLSVTVGNNACVVSARTNSELKCTVPPYKEGPFRVEVTVSVGASTSTLTNAILYMTV